MPAPLRRAALVAPLCAAVLAACASAPAAGTLGSATGRRDMVAIGDQTLMLDPTTHTVQQDLALPAERAWALLPLAYEAAGLPLTTLDSEKRLIGAGGVRAQGRLKGTWLSRYVDCGTASTGQPNADSYAVTLDVATQVDGRADGAGSGLRTVVRASGRPASTSSSNPVNCVSRGELEKRLAELVRAEAAKTP